MSINYKTNNENNSNILPPGFQQLSKFKFGKLFLDINTSQLQQLQLQIISYEFQFLGANKIQSTLQKSQIQFDIKTSLWHFYSYLADMKNLQFKFNSKNGKKYKCSKGMNLQNFLNVFKKQYLKGSYLLNPIQLCDIHQQGNQNESVGHVMIKTKLSFDEQVHRQICQVIDFANLIKQCQQSNNQLQLPKNDNKNQNKSRQEFQFFQTKKQQKNSASLLSLNNINPQIKIKNNNPLISFQKDSNNNMTNSYNFKEDINIRKENQLNFNNISKNSDIKYVPDFQQSNMEDQIDRLIAQMQNRPYDSSRYIENQSNVSNANSFYQQLPPNQSQGQSYNQRSNLHLSKTMSSVLPQRQQLSKSPINKKYPPIPIANKTVYDNNSNINLNLNQNMTTIYSQRSISPSHQNQNRSLGKSNNLMHTKSLSNISLNSNTKYGNNNSKGKLKISIHQLIVSELQEDSYILKIFINDQFEQFYACKGNIHGEVIVFNQKTELKTSLNQIQKLKFVLYDWQDKIVGESTFFMERLIKVPTLQGIFMLNLHKSHEYLGETVIASQSIIKKVQTPNQKSLRISIQYEQLIQIVQIYINLTKFNFQFKTCKYKIPFTKQTVQFYASDSHFNVFPHNKDCNKLIIQFWSQQNIIGTTQVNLTALSNTTKTMMEMSVQPIYLYDCMFSVSDIFKKMQVGKFKLLVCFGNIRQIQHLLNNQRQPNKQSAKQRQKQKIQVNYEQKLGIFVKQRSNNKQIQIQVDPEQLQQQQSSPSSFRQQKNNKFLVNSKTKTEANHQKQKQKQKLKDSEIQEKDLNLLNSSHISQAKSQNQFLNDNKMNTNVSSRFHQLKLHQQEQDDQNFEDQKDDFRTSNFIKGKKEPFYKQIQKNKTNTKVQLRQLNSLTTTLTKQIKSILECLWKNDQKNFNQLKNIIKKYLLYNFVQVPVFKNCLMELGTTHRQIQQIIGVLDPIEDMINFNILSDLICSISLSSQVRSNLISDKKLSKCALEVYYKKSCEEIQENIQNWLNNNVIENIITLDENIQFNQMRAYFKNFDYKLSMSQFNMIIQYLENLKKQSKNSKTQKLDIISNLIKRHKEEQHEQRYQESILKKIYQDNQFQNSLNDSKISEIHNNFTSESRILNNSKQRMIEQDDDDDLYIINQLNNHKNITKKSQQQKFISLEFNQVTKNDIQQKNQKKSYQNQPKICLQNISFAKKQSSKSKSSTQNNFEQKVKSQTNNEKQKSKIFASQQNNILQRQILKNSSKLLSNQHILKVQGIQSCKDSFQCQLDRVLQYPKISLSIRSPISSVLYFNEQQTSQTIVCQDDFDEVQGVIQLYDRSQLLGHAAFVVMKSVKSMYTLRTIKDEIFCGLVSIFIQ